MDSRKWYRVGLWLALPALGCSGYLLTTPGAFHNDTLPHGLQWVAVGIGGFFALASIIVTFHCAGKAERREICEDCREAQRIGSPNL